MICLFYFCVRVGVLLWGILLPLRLLELRVEIFGRVDHWLRPFFILFDLVATVVLVRAVADDDVRPVLVRFAEVAALGEHIDIKVRLLMKIVPVLADGHAAGRHLLLVHILLLLSLTLLRADHIYF